MKKWRTKAGIGLIVGLLALAAVFGTIVFPVLWTTVLQTDETVRAHAEELVAAYREETGEELPVRDVVRDVVYLDWKWYLTPEEIRGVEDGHIVYAADVADEKETVEMWISRSPIGSYHLEMTSVFSGVVTVFDTMPWGTGYVNGKRVS